MAEVNQGGGADKEELEHPVADVGDGEGFVIADIGAARLLGVAHKIRLLVPPHGLPGQAQDEDAEDEEHGQPDLPDHGRVLLDLVQQFLQETPVAHLLGSFTPLAEESGNERS
uniref:Uncharacterized protein n=1 Tax=Apteryx owenii TaxID=8824 RepID=A0A8B9PPP0_APTOW